MFSSVQGTALKKDYLVFTKLIEYVYNDVINIPCSREGMNKLYALILRSFMTEVTERFVTSQATNESRHDHFLCSIFSIFRRNRKLSRTCNHFLHSHCTCVHVCIITIIGVG